MVRVRPPWGAAGSWAGTRYRGIAVVTVTVTVTEPVENASHEVTNSRPGPAAVTRTARGAGLSVPVTVTLARPEKLFSNRRV